MYQDLSNQQKSDRTSSTTIPVEPWSIEGDADQLMDELFSDLDRLLENGTQLPPEPTQPEYVSLQSVVVPPMSLPPVLRQSEDMEQVRSPQGPPTPSPVNTKRLKVKRVNPNRGLVKHLDIILFGTACASLIAVILWLVSQEKLKLPLMVKLREDTIAQTALSEADAQFINYMLRSLEVIDRKAKMNPSAPATVATAPGNTATERVIERVYIPVYPPTQPPTVMMAPPPPTAAAPQQALPQPSASVAPSPAASPTPPPPTPPTVAEETQPSPEAETPPVAAAPTGNYVLNGLLELGDRSAALFDINNTTYRIRVGEQIGSSGWTLISVSNQRAVIRRNGEVRSIYVGQRL